MTLQCRGILFDDDSFTAHKKLMPSAKRVGSTFVAAGNITLHVKRKTRRFIGPSRCRSTYSFLLPLCV